MHHIDSWTRRQRALVAGILVAGTAVALPATAAAGTPTRADDPTAPLVEPDGVIPEGVPSGDGGGGDDHVVSQLTDEAGNPIGPEVTYDPQGVEVRVGEDGELTPVATPRGGGSEGSSTRSGCRRVTTKNEYETALGATAFYFNQVIRWCWDRDQRRVYDVTLGHYLEDVDPLYHYRGHTSHNRYFYEYRAGYKNSGYITDRQARFENCVPTPQGQLCLGSYYPRNITRAHDNGTWSWNTY
jgi:hypothetical protein